MLLEYADELEQEEREMAKRQAAWEAETARLAAEQAAFEAEQAKIAAQQAEARRVAEEAAKEAARLAELNKPPPQPIKVCRTGCVCGVQQGRLPGMTRWYSFATAHACS